MYGCGFKLLTILSMLLPYLVVTRRPALSPPRRTCNFTPHKIYSMAGVIGKGFHRTLQFDIVHGRGDTCIRGHFPYHKNFFLPTYSSPFVLEIGLSGHLYVLPSEVAKESLVLETKIGGGGTVPPTYLEIESLILIPPSHELEIEAPVSGPPIKLYVGMKWARAPDLTTPVAGTTTTLSIPVHLRYGLPNTEGTTNLSHLCIGIVNAVYHITPRASCGLNHFKYFENGIAVVKGLSPGRDGSADTYIIPVGLIGHAWFVGPVNTFVVWFLFFVIIAILFKKDLFPTSELKK